MLCLRWIVTILSLTVLFWFMGSGAARAEAEFCPASVDWMYAFPAPREGLHSFYVFASSERTVSANVIVETDQKWYTFQVLNARISADLAHYRTSTVHYDYTFYHSRPLYVQLPAGENVVRTWVNDAFSSGDTQFGWDTKGDVDCLPAPGGDPKVPVEKDRPVRTNPLNELEQLPSAAETVIAPTAMDPPADLKTCATPFVPARVRSTIAPAWPTGIAISVPLSTDVEVAVSPDGKLADAWVYKPSGIPELDLAAVKAAKLSKYQPGTALCHPAPGYYLFRADFQP